MAEPEAIQTKTIEQVTKEHVLATLQALHGNKSKAAEALGIHRRSLYRLLERYRKESFDPFTPSDGLQRT